MAETSQFSPNLHSELDTVPSPPVPVLARLCSLPPVLGSSATPSGAWMSRVRESHGPSLVADLGTLETAPAFPMFRLCFPRPQSGVSALPYSPAHVLVWDKLSQNPRVLPFQEALPSCRQTQIHIS